jgi:Zn-dependent protease
MRHLDPLGTAMILFAGFGWGKPTPVNPLQLRRPVRGMTLVSIAGPISNLALASLLALPLRLGWLPLPEEIITAPNVFSGDLPAVLGAVLLFALYINVVLAVFNLLPVAPLDGFKVVQGLLPAEPRRAFSRLESYGPLLLMGVILLDLAFNVGILARLLFPPIQFFVTLMLG